MILGEIKKILLNNLERLKYLTFRTNEGIL